VVALRYFWQTTENGGTSLLLGLERQLNLAMKFFRNRLILRLQKKREINGIYNKQNRKTKNNIIKE
jgi:hypothetical protein